MEFHDADGAGRAECGADDDTCRRGHAHTPISNCGHLPSALREPEQQGVARCRFGLFSTERSVGAMVRRRSQARVRGGRDECQGAARDRSRR